MSIRPVILRSKLLEAMAGVVHGFTTRQGGVSEGPYASLNLGHGVGDERWRVEDNRRLVERSDGVGLIHMARQVHGARVLHVDTACSPSAVAREEADALVTTEVGKPLGVRTADCVPILLVDEAAGVIAAAHAGWRGTVAGMAGEVVRTMSTAHGASPASIRAAVGPAIGPCCYEVGSDVARRIERIDPMAVSPHGGAFRADIREANRRALTNAGLLNEHIELVGGCTACDGGLFFSHRREKALTGRHVAYIALI